MTVFEELKRRGLIAQSTNEENQERLESKEQISFYIDLMQLPTASTWGISSIDGDVAFAKAGHRPIVLLGTGTTMIGDPSGKTDMRQMMSNEQIEHNAECLSVMSRFLDFSDGKVIVARMATG